VSEPGENLFLLYRSNNPDIDLKVQCDGVSLRFGSAEVFSPSLLYTWGFTASTPGLSLLKKQPAGYENSFVITFPFRWKRQLVLIAIDASGEGGVVDVGINYNRRLG